MSSRQEQVIRNTRIVNNINTLFKDINTCTKINDSSLDNNNKNKEFITFLNNSIQHDLITLKDINYNDRKGKITKILIDTPSNDIISIIYEHQGTNVQYYPKSTYQKFIEDLYIIDDKTIYYIEKALVKLVTPDLRVQMEKFNTIKCDKIDLDHSIFFNLITNIKLKIKYENIIISLFSRFINHLNTKIANEDITLKDTNFLSYGYIKKIEYSKDKTTKQLSFKFTYEKKDKIENYLNITYEKFINNIYLSDDEKNYFYIDKNIINNKSTIYYKKLLMLAPELEAKFDQNTRILEKIINLFFTNENIIYEQINTTNFDTDIDNMKRYIHELNISDKEIIDVLNHNKGNIKQISYIEESGKHMIKYIYEKSTEPTKFSIAELKVFLDNLYIDNNKLYFVMPFAINYNNTVPFKSIKICLKDITTYLNKGISPSASINLSSSKKKRIFKSYSSSELQKIDEKTERKAIINEIQKSTNFITDLRYITMNYKLEDKAQLEEFLEKLYAKNISEIPNVIRQRFIKDSEQKTENDKLNYYTTQYYRLLYIKWNESKVMLPPLSKDTSAVRKRTFELPPYNKIIRRTPSSLYKKQKINTTPGSVSAGLSGGNNKITRKINIDSNNKLYIKYNDIIIYLKTK